MQSVQLCGLEGCTLRKQTEKYPNLKRETGNKNKILTKLSGFIKQGKKTWANQLNVSPGTYVLRQISRPTIIYISNFTIHWENKLGCQSL